MNGNVDDLAGYDFVGNPLPDTDPFDAIGHGAHVAGIVGAVGNNGIGITGVSQEVRLMA